MEVSSNARAIFGSVAKAKGFQLPQEVQTTILHQLDRAIRYEGGAAYLVDLNGNRAVTADATGKVIDQRFNDFIADLVKPFLDTTNAQTTDAPKRGQPTKNAAPQPINLTEKMREMLAERKSKAAQLATDIRGNPWSRETLNLTHQMLISRADPVRAERLKREAKN